MQQKLWTSTNGLTHKIILVKSFGEKKQRTLCLSATGRSLRKDQSQHLRNCKRCFHKKFISHKLRNCF